MAGGGDEIGQVAEGSQAFSRSVQRSDFGISKQEVERGVEGSESQGSFAITGGGGAENREKPAPTKENP